MKTIGVIGAGAWGTALAVAARRAGRDVVLQAHNPDVAASINATHKNPIYLPHVTLDGGIRATASLANAAQADAVLLVAPAQHLGQVCEGLKPHLEPGTPVVICSKGIEIGSCRMMSEVVAAKLPDAPVAVLSGPTFAIEVARDLPTALTLASADRAGGEALMAALASPRFRIYYTDDVIGTQIGGAIKNVMAIACGIVEGRGLGDNTRAALITRGLAEIARVGRAQGARLETLMGLSGLGDLTLTCSAMQSRNYSLGMALGQGQSLDQILGARRSVTEGVYTATSVTDLAGRLGVEVPICAAVDGVLNHGADIDRAIDGLLSRPLKDEYAR